MPVHAWSENLEHDLLSAVIFEKYLKEGLGNRMNNFYWSHHWSQDITCLNNIDPYYMQ